MTQEAMKTVWSNIQKGVLPIIPTRKIASDQTVKNLAASLRHENVHVVQIVDCHQSGSHWLVCLERGERTRQSKCG